ncbi:MAG: carbohydrate binding family 9 domain-containing protein, partial [Acidobacteria bacterium]|nr:carbohydrate binding family 9 domain-containing protein [Acidobacteriota bacterium]
MKKNIFTNFVGITIVFLLNSFTVQAKLSAPSTEKEVLYPVRITEKIKIDGVLDEKTWQMPSLVRDFSSFSPHVGEVLPYKTEVLMAYDNKNLYFAFLCHDPEPHKIKNSLAKRDNIDSDDRVGLSLDALGTKQNAWAIYTNPSGVQMDFLYSAVSDTELDPDIVWESAGKITGKGYQVECAIPLTSLTFKSGDNVKMGILFWRVVPRLGISACWPKYVPGGKVFSTETDIIYRQLKKPLTLELLPNIFYSKSQERLNPSEWGSKDIFKGIGLDVKYGLTSSLTADMTYNPDFSQVESDTFQVEVNQRYPLFYAEKRPFFMEAATAFHFFTLGNGFFPRAVHTRQIVDPQWGIKLTGSVGKFAVGLLAAGDEWPGLNWEVGDNPNKDKQAFFGIARTKYSLGDDSYIGFLYSGREFSGQFNRVFGADCLYRFLKYHRIQASFLKAKSSGSDSANYDLNSSKGNNINFNYSLTTKNIEINAAFEHIGSDFRMDSAYLLRTGIDHGKALALYNFLPGFKKSNWLKRITPMVIYRFIHDLKTGKNDFD